MNAKNDTPAESESTAEAGTPEANTVETAAPADADAVSTASTVETKAEQATESGSTVVTSESDTEVVTTNGEAAPTPVQTVYVTAPTPPRPKGNRGIGVLLGVVATIVFAIVYAAAIALFILFANHHLGADTIAIFLTRPLFYVPVLAFLVMIIVWALLANRASWWSWVIGSLVIALVTYFASIGVLLLLAGGFGLTASAATAKFFAYVGHPALIAAALLARECAIWFGAAIAKRGRRVRERNYEAWQAFENEQAQKRAELGPVAAV